jgi:hypothetical protein
VPHHDLRLSEDFRNSQQIKNRPQMVIVLKTDYGPHSPYRNHSTVLSTNLMVLAYQAIMPVSISIRAKICGVQSIAQVDLSAVMSRDQLGTAGGKSTGRESATSRAICI